MTKKNSRPKKSSSAKGTRSRSVPPRKKASKPSLTAKPAKKKAASPAIRGKKISVKSPSAKRPQKQPAKAASAPKRASLKKPQSGRAASKAQKPMKALPKTGRPSSSSKRADGSKSGVSNRTEQKIKKAMTDGARPADLTASQPPAPIQCDQPQPVRNGTAANNAPPSRAPIRKVFGPDNKLLAVVEKHDGKRGGSAAEPLAPQSLPTHQSLPTQSLSTQASPSHSVTEPRISFTETGPSAVVNQIPLPKVFSPFGENSPAVKTEEKRHSWSSLPGSVSGQLQGRIKALEAECLKAESSPFPFAKFIHSLPTECCGMQFAAMLTALRGTIEDAGKALGIPSPDVQPLLESAATKITDLFAMHCPNMFRSWKVQLVGRTLQVETLIEQHLIAALDRDLQRTVASVTLRALGGDQLQYAA